MLTETSVEAIAQFHSDTEALDKKHTSFNILTDFEIGLHTRVETPQIFFSLIPDTLTLQDLKIIVHHTHYREGRIGVKTARNLRSLSPALDLDLTVWCTKLKRAHNVHIERSCSIVSYLISLSC